MGAYLAASLRQGRAEVDRRWPSRSRLSDGWIGDRAHQAETSDHNPDPPSMVVRATDTTVAGIDPELYVRACCHHPATRYVIFNRVIRHRRDNFAPRRYTGPNPHDRHVHRSIEHTGDAERDTTPLALGVALAPSPVPPGRAPMMMPNLARTLSYRRGDVMTGADVRMWQAQMRLRGWAIGIDGVFGPECDAVARRFQRDKRLHVDGKVGPRTWAATWRAPIT